MSSTTDILQARPTFASIVCGVDGNDPGFEAARQAAILTDEGAALTYVAVSWDQIADDPSRRLPELATGQDLLVLGIKGNSRAAGIVIGSAATAALHGASVPVLVARRPPEGVAFPERIVLASDGTPMSDAATELVARLAARHGSTVSIVGARDGEAPFQPGLAEHANQIKLATGTEPFVLVEPGPPHRAVAEAARRIGASLVVTGSRRLAGAAALRSVSERIAHAAPCSVLTVRAR